MCQDGKLLGPQVWNDSSNFENGDACVGKGGEQGRQLDVLAHGDRPSDVEPDRV
jgi:hypothetical protein